MSFLKFFNPEIDWTTGATTMDEYTIALVKHQAYTSKSRLEILSAKDVVKGSKQGKYTWCGYVYPTQIVPQQAGQLNFTHYVAYVSSDKGFGDVSTNL